MFKRYFELIENVELGPLVALVLFFLVFLVMTFWIFRLDDKFVNRMKNMPLDGQEEDQGPLQ